MKFKFSVDGKSYEWDKHITGSELRKIASLDPDSSLFLKVQGADEEVNDVDKIDLARFGIEHFYSVPRHPKFSFTINGKHHLWNDKFITSIDLRKIGGIPEDYSIFLKVQGKDVEIADDEKVDLARFGIEHFYSREKSIVIIHIDDKDRKIKRGNQPVSEIKKVGDVPAAYELEQVIDGTLTPLDDNGHVVIKGGEVFFSHPRGGGSS